MKEVFLALLCCWNCLYKGTWHQGDVATTAQIIGSCFGDSTSTETPDSQAEIHLWVNKILLSSCLCDHTSKWGELMWKYLFQGLLLPVLRVEEAHGHFASHPHGQMSPVELCPDPTFLPIFGNSCQIPGSKT